MIRRFHSGFLCNQLPFLLPGLSVARAQAPVDFSEEDKVGLLVLVDLPRFDGAVKAFGVRGPRFPGVGGEGFGGGFLRLEVASGVGGGGGGSRDEEEGEEEAEDLRELVGARPALAHGGW